MTKEKKILLNYLLKQYKKSLREMKQSDKYTDPKKQLEYIKAFYLFAYISPNRATQYKDQAERLYQNKQYKQLEHYYQDIWNRMN